MSKHKIKMHRKNLASEQKPKKSEPKKEIVLYADWRTKTHKMTKSNKDLLKFVLERPTDCRSFFELTYFLFILFHFIRFYLAYVCAFFAVERQRSGHLELIRRI